MAELAAIWAELQAFGEQIEDVPLAELRDRLTEFEARILDVVRADRHRGAATGDGRRTTGGGTGVSGSPGDQDDGSGSSGEPAGTTGRARSTAGPTGGAASTGGAGPTSGSSSSSAGGADPRRSRAGTPDVLADGDRDPVRLSEACRASGDDRGRGGWRGIPSSPSPGGPVSEPSAAGAVRNLDLLGIYCNDHLAAATGGIELVSRMLGRHRGSRLRAAARGAARRAPRGARRPARRRWPRSASRSASTSRSASWVGEKLSRREAQRAPAVPLAAQRPGRVRVHRHGGARQAGRLRDPAGDRGGGLPAGRRRCSSG